MIKLVQLIIAGLTEKPVLTLIIVAFATATFCMTLIMPAAELLPAQVTTSKPQPGDSFFRSEELMKFFKNLGDSALGVLGQKTNIEEVIKKDPLFPYKMWSVFFAGALVAAGFAFNAVGREESEEKTVIPVKK